MLKYVTILFSILLLTLAASSLQAQETLKIGAQMPLNTKGLPDVSGGKTTIGSVKGAKGTLVMFWCNTCPWVKRYEERMVALAADYMARGFGVIAVNPNDPVAYPGDSMDEMKRQAENNAYGFPYVSDAGSEVAKAFGAKRTPQAFLFNASDVLVYQGAFDDSPSDAGKVEASYLKDALDAVLAGKAIALTETKAFGCTIKFQ
ncbi:MAG: thioredoxin family protein [Rhodothermales bacterium]